ncbi:MAG: recombination mediator RecR [Propionibacteriaceae bacterium]
MFEGPVQELIDELGRLPGIGPKSAQRVAFFLLNEAPEDVQRLADVLVRVTQQAKFCSTCGNLSEDDICRICRDPRREAMSICVVEEVKDVAAIERTHEFKGTYHVLGGAISPIDGIGPSDLRVRELCQRLADGTVQEVILATDPNLEGEATATYLARLLNPMGVTVTRLASGLPVGGDLEYADDVTLGRALSGRRTIGS